MSEERFEQDESKDTTEDDVEAHKTRVRMGNEEPAAEDESDDVEAHARRMQHRDA
jgi:hypothetical protein